VRRTFFEFTWNSTAAVALARFWLIIGTIYWRMFQETLCADREKLEVIVKRRLNVGTIRELSSHRRAGKRARCDEGMKTWVIPKQCARIVVHFTCILVSNSRRTPSGSVCTPFPFRRTHSTVSSVGRLWGMGVYEEKDFIMGSKTAASNSGWLVVWNIKCLFPAIALSPIVTPNTA